MGPTAMFGLATAGLVAYAGSRGWVDLPEAAVQQSSVTGEAPLGEVPLVGALGLVALAAWGVLLVSRGRVRRAIALLGAVALLGALAASMVGLADVTDATVASLAERGFAKAEVSMNLWAFISPVFALIGACVFVAAFRAAPQWAEMGGKYDAPTTGSKPAPSVGVVADTRNLDLWKSLDEGHDPTADSGDGVAGEDQGEAQPRNRPDPGADPSSDTHH